MFAEHPLQQKCLSEQKVKPMKPLLRAVCRLDRVSSSEREKLGPKCHGTARQNGQLQRGSHYLVCSRCQNPPVFHRGVGEGDQTLQGLEAGNE